MGKIKTYGIEVQAKLLDVHRNTLSNLKRDDNELYKILITGLIVYTEQANDQFLPFLEIAAERGTKPIKIKKREVLAFRNTNPEILIIGKMVLETYGLDYEDLDDFISTRMRTERKIIKGFKDGVEEYEKSGYSKELLKINNPILNKFLESFIK